MLRPRSVDKRLARVFLRVGSFKLFELVLLHIGDLIDFSVFWLFTVTAQCWHNRQK